LKSDFEIINLDPDPLPASPKSGINTLDNYAKNSFGFGGGARRAEVKKPASTTEGRFRLRELSIVYLIS
jgi:hypothetical protein